MEILLLIAIIAVGASGLYVAVTFNTRTKQNFAPLMNDAEKNIDEKIEAASGELRQQVQAVTDELRRNRELVGHLEAASGELRQQVQAFTDELRQDRELLKRLDEQIDTRHNQLGKDLAQLDRRVAELRESLAQQNDQISGIYRYAMRQETQAGSSAENDSLLLAMLEAESYVDGKGWDGRPHLYALTEKASTAVADREFAAEMRGARRDALVPVEHERLPDGDLIEVLAGIHWPADVVGCVLVTELAALPPRNEEDALVDAGAAGQWASTHPDGRPARLAVGVCRSGEHTCGLRIKGEDEIQVRTELAGDFVTALLGTF
jgi:F0F1-type ATP synthase membrane subunit b/b'